MKRSLSEFTNTSFDIVIVGGGITGACLAADAALRGLSVALVEKGDFGAATSSASSKLLHGGIRYLQQLNFAKVRESAKERIYFQQLAPHLTHYVPFIIPTYKSLSKGKFVMKSAMTLYEILCGGQNSILRDASKKVPSSHFLSRAEVGKVVPNLESDAITGGVVFYESHMYSSERMTLGFIETAQQHGACVANYLEVTSFPGADEGRVRGVRVKDRLSGESFEIKASLVINAAGPWIPLLNSNTGSKNSLEGVVSAFSKGAHIVTRSLTQGHAVALPTRKQNKAVINRGGRHVFIIPWRGYSLIGTTYGPYEGDLDDVCATEGDINEMIEDINSALGSKKGEEALKRDDVYHAYAGIYPLIDEVIDTKVYQGTGKYQVVDHAESDNLAGLVSVFGAKFTTARLLAEKALDEIISKHASRFNKQFDSCQTRRVALSAGHIDDLQVFRKEQVSRYKHLFSATVINNLVTNYGTDIQHVCTLCEENDQLTNELVAGSAIIAAEVVYAARHEMACHLDDFVFRRTGLGTLGNPGNEVLLQCATLMGQELGWDQTRIDAEWQRMLKGFPVDKANAK